MSLKEFLVVVLLGVIIWVLYTQIQRMNSETRTVNRQVYER